MSDIAQFLKRVSGDVDATLDEIVPSPDAPPERLHQAIRWSLFAGGKRIRPGVVYAVGETFGATTDSLAKTAAAIEMIHTFSLIHDDLPAMDDDDLRRGRETCHKKFDEATAILAGDALLAMAFETIASDSSFDCELRVKLVADIAAASATPRGMVAGQQLDIEGESRDVSLEELETIHACKTGALIAASAKAGAMIGGCSPDEMAAIERFADRLGLLFQVTDDLLDVTQPTETLGKTAGKDIAANKATYPALLGIDGTREKIASVRDEALNALSRLQQDTRLLADLVEMIAGRTS